MSKKELNRLSIAAVALFFIASTGSLPCFAQQSLLRILSPTSGLEVHPGQTVTIKVAADASVQKLILTAPHPLGMGEVELGQLGLGNAAGIVAQGRGEANPIVFLLTIPNPIQPGIYHVTAIGKTPSGTVESYPLALDVERADNPIRIWAEPSSIQFTQLEDRIPVRVLGEFADGSQIDLTRSSRTKFTSADTGVASVASDGMVTAVAEGKTDILMRTPSVDYTIAARVQPAN
jgi:hypothetical protein